VHLDPRPPTDPCDGRRQAAAPATAGIAGSHAGERDLGRLGLRGRRGRIDIDDELAPVVEVEPEWLIEAASRRQKWIDQGQSLNLYIGEPNGKKLNDMYMMAWKKGLKTTYYLRSRGATQTEKSTLDVNRFGIQPRWMKSESASSGVVIDRASAPRFTAGTNITQSSLQPNPAATISTPKLNPLAPKAVSPAPMVAQAAPTPQPLNPAPVPVAHAAKPQVSVPLVIPNVNELRMRTSHDLPVEEEFGCEACQ
jgi:ribonucleotide reductase alpha subunit